MKLHAVILCGGSGTRLWPLSRTEYPKQFLQLAGNASLLQDTITRVQPLSPAKYIFVGSERHRSLLTQEVTFISKPTTIFLEPSPKNTAPAATLVALTEQDDDPLLLILPADHYITASEHFYDCLRSACQYAQTHDVLLCFGIQPTSPETGYGYIEQGDYCNDEHTIYSVRSFIEKPSLERAQAFLQDGRYYWNSGIFLFRSSVWLKAVQTYAANIVQDAHKALEQSYSQGNIVLFSHDCFDFGKGDSIDFAVMEHANNTVCMPLDIVWSDLGSFESLQEVSHHSTAITHANHVSINTENCYIYPSERLIATVNVENLVIVDTPDALLVAKKDSQQSIKELVAHMTALQLSQVDSSTCVYRPWGHYQTLARGSHFQVKCITVNPGASLSLQLHHHRAEHWVVVEGTAKVINGDKEILLSEDQSTYIPLGSVHRLENPGRIPLRLIEVQTGSYLGEDDILRLEDRYDRT